MQCPHACTRIRTHAHKSTSCREEDTRQRGGSWGFALDRVLSYLFLAAVVAVAAYDILAAISTTLVAAVRAAVTAVVAADIANHGKTL